MFIVKLKVSWTFIKLHRWSALLGIQIKYLIHTEGLKHIECHHELCFLMSDQYYFPSLKETCMLFGKYQIKKKEFTMPVNNEDDLQSKTINKANCFFYIQMNYRSNHWKHFAWVLWNHISQKRRHKGKNLQRQLAKEDVLQSKSVIKEIVFRIFFFT